MMLFKVNFKKAFDTDLDLDYGSPTSEFNVRHGLREGDPLYPFLIIIMEGLHPFVFADDVVIITEWSRHDMDNIIQVFQVFYLASGLKINIHKSNIYGFGVSTEGVHLMDPNTGCATGTFPVTYLRLLIG
ncbi:hypothetical protein Tco_0483678 [Tanacetum coccineum]